MWQDLSLTPFSLYIFTTAFQWFSNTPCYFMVVKLFGIFKISFELFQRLFHPLKISTCFHDQFSHHPHQTLVSYVKSRNYVFILTKTSNCKFLSLHNHHKLQNRGVQYCQHSKDQNIAISMHTFIITSCTESDSLCHQ